MPSCPSNINFGWRTEHPVSSFSYSGWKEFSGERDFRQAVFAVLGPAGLSSPVSQASVFQVCNSGLHWTGNSAHCVSTASVTWNFASATLKTHVCESTHGRVIFNCLSSLQRWHTLYTVQCTVCFQPVWLQIIAYCYSEDTHECTHCRNIIPCCTSL